MAINRPDIAKSYYGGLSDGKPCGLVGPTLTGWYTPYDQWPADLQAGYTYNPTGAKQLLANAGYSNGFNTNALAPSNQDTTLLQVIKAELMDIGINMAINVSDLDTFSAITSAGKQDQMVYSDGQAGYLVSPAISLSYLTSAAIPQMNDTFNKDAHYDALYGQMLNAADTAEMQKLSAATDLYALQNYWMVPILPTKTQFVVWQSWIKGYTGECLADTMWAAAVRARCWVDQSLKK